MEESKHVGEQETSLQDQSYHTIRRKIVYLDYKPGEKLGVKQLCDDLDMGRTPVREALVRLAQEGLVRTVPQSGTYVSPINLTFAESACYIREHLEKQVIVECCARATSAGIEQLDRAIGQAQVDALGLNGNSALAKRHISRRSIEHAHGLAGNHAASGCGVGRSQHVTHTIERPHLRIQTHLLLGNLCSMRDERLILLGPHR